jgi:phage terminase large subunit GpA-like protein
VSTALQSIFEALADGLELPPDLSISEWAELHRILPRETTREHGPWRNSRVPFMTEIMDALGPHDPCERVVLMKGAQIAGTEVALNALGYWMAHDPSSILIVSPSLDDARKFSRRRIRPLILSTPSLAALVGEGRTRSAAGNTLYREFPGGALVMVGANAPGGLAGNPIRRLIFDDADMSPGEAGTQGDPLKLAEVRTRTYSNRKIYVNGTPNLEGDSRVETLFLQSDKRRYFVPCLSCGRMDFLTRSGYGNFKDLDDPGHFRLAWDDHRTETAHFVCGGCGARIEENAKTEMFARGEWRPTAAGDGRTKGYHLPSFYSPHGWLKWSEIAREIEEAGSDPPKLKIVVNLSFAETWRQTAGEIKAKTLQDRFETYAADVPSGVAVLELAIDVQDYGLVYQVDGYGVGEQSWTIEYGEIPGDPAKLLDGTGPDGLVVDQLRARTWKHESGRDIGIDCTVIDSGGHHTSDVYDYVKPRFGSKVYAIRGGNGLAAELVSKGSKRRNKGGVNLWTLGVDDGKGTIYGRLKISSPGPGFIHFPEPDPGEGRWLWANAEYAAGLVSEGPVRRRDHRRGWVIGWKKLRDRNEPWDLKVYTLAAFRIRKPQLGDLEARAKALAEPIPEGGENSAEEKPAAPVSRSQRWIPPRRGWMRR